MSEVDDPEAQAEIDSDASSATDDRSDDESDSSVADDGASDVESESDVSTAEEDTCSDAPPAQWMSGKWGIGWRIRVGNTSEYNVKKIVKQIKGIPGVGYVMIGLSEGASGSRYIAPHSVLSKITRRATPGKKRDLFDEFATAFQAAGYKVLVYMATEGPSKLKHGAANAFDYDKKTKTAPSIENWKRYVKKRYGSADVNTLKKAYAEVIVKEYAERYGSKVDGWWFDHASFGNKKLLHSICKKANPKTVMSFNSGRLPNAMNSNPGLEDYTFGHPTPLRRYAACAPDNLRMVKAVEKSKDGFLYEKGKPSLGHLFMPMMHYWNKGKEPVWSEEQAVDWMSRTLTAGGAWTWNVPIDHRKRMLSPDAVSFMKSVARGMEQVKVEGGPQGKVHPGHRITRPKRKRRKKKK